MPARPAESAQRRAEQSAMLVSSKQGDRAGFKTEQAQALLSGLGLITRSTGSGWHQGPRVPGAILKCES